MLSAQWGVNASMRKTESPEDGLGMDLDKQNWIITLMTIMACQARANREQTNVCSHHQVIQTEEINSSERKGTGERERERARLTKNLITEKLNWWNILKCNNKTFLNISFSLPDLPDPPSELKIVKVASRSFELFWKESFDGNVPLKKFTISYKEANG